MTVQTKNSTNSVFTSFTGTPQEVINAMDAAGINTLDRCIACYHDDGSTNEEMTVIVEKRA